LRKVDLIYLAAGRGSRLGELTTEKPKCFVNIFGKSLIEYFLRLKNHPLVGDVNVVAGYKHECFDVYQGVNLLNNANWANTNMVHSLRIALENDSSAKPLLIVYSDIFLNPLEWDKIIEEVAKNKYIFCPSYANWKKLWSRRMENPLNDLESFRLKDGFLIEIGGEVKEMVEIEGQFMGVLGVPANRKAVFKDALDDYLLTKEDATSTTDFLQFLIKKKEKIKVIQYGGVWFEVDSQTDVEVYQSLFQTHPTDIYELIESKKLKFFSRR